MAVVIRVVYNNQDWGAPCKTPGKDNLCWYCFMGILDIRSPKRDDAICSGHCWEQYLCNDYKWGCTPKGRVFGYQAYRGATVFLVFKQPDGNYTIWAKTTVSAVDTEPMKNGNDYEEGFAFIHFNPFAPLPRDKWVRNISDVRLVGAKWLQGRYRYIDANQEKYLEQLIEGEAPEEKVETAVATQTGGIDLSITVMPNVYKKLESIANEEGRQIDEIVREAIAEWVKERNS